MKLVKINKVRLMVEENLVEAGRALKTALNKELDKAVKPRFTVKSSFIGDKVITNISIMIMYNDRPITVGRNIETDIVKGKTDIDLINEQAKILIDQVELLVKEKASEFSLV